MAAPVAPTEPHPYVALWRTRDTEAFGRHLADGAVLRSPILRSPFRGRAEVQALLVEVVANLEDARIEGPFRGEQGADVFLWRASARGRPLEGCDVFRYDGEGRIAEITVMIRPLVGIADFASAVGPAMARRVRGRAGGRLMVLLGPGLRGFMALTDRLAARMTQRR